MVAGFCQTLAGELADAARALSSLPPVVTIYGSARLAENTPEYLAAERLARRFSDMGFTVFSGGGPGIMEAVNKGAYAGRGQSVGLNIRLPHEQRANPYQDVALEFESFTSRKDTFNRYSQVYIVMPGGFGTLDELFQTLTLVQTGKAVPAPIILVGTAFWQGLLDWIDRQILARGMISDSERLLLTVTDDEEAVVQAALPFLQAA